MRERISTVVCTLVEAESVGAAVPRRFAGNIWLLASDSQRPQRSAQRCSASRRMPARASDVIYAAPASADSLPCGVPRETESPGPGASIPEFAVDDPRRRRVRRFRGTGCPASAVPAAPTWNRSVAGIIAESVAVPPSCRFVHRTVSRETLAEVRRPRLSDRWSVTSRDMGRAVGRVPVSDLWSKPR